MASKPKPCKYGCGTVITWNESQRFFQGPDGQKHDCRDWDKSAFPPTVAETQLRNPAGGGVYSTAPPPSGETLIEVHAKKTWENYFKLLEPILANLAAIASQTDATNKLLIELGNKIKSLDDTLIVTKTKSKPKEETGEKENGA